MSQSAADNLITLPDARWNSWRWRPVLERWGSHRVFIDPNILKTTAFIIEGGERMGTVFFVRVPLGKNPHDLFGEDYYAITANHVLGKSMSLRLPMANGQFQDKEIPLSDWTRDKEKDIAILPIDFSLARYDLYPIPIRRAVTDREYLIAAQPNSEYEGFFHWGTGDEVFTVGLFDQDLGQGSDRPVARFGHVALRPAEGELLTIEIEGDTLVGADGFLVEMAGWPGQSGSPVFMRPWPDIDRMSAERPQSEVSFLLGMVQGFYPGGTQDVEIDQTPFRVSGLNMGISVILPARTFVDLLGSPELLERRERMLSQRVRTKRPRRAAKGKEDQ